MSGRSKRALRALMPRGLMMRIRDYRRFGNSQGKLIETQAGFRQFKRRTFFDPVVERDRQKARRIHQLLVERNNERIARGPDANAPLAAAHGKDKRAGRYRRAGSQGAAA